MKGVIASIAPGAPLIDITHGVPAQSIAAGAIALAQTWRLFPPRTVFLVVVDPGVGTARLPVAVQTRAGARASSGPTTACSRWRWRRRGWRARSSCARRAIGSHA